MHDKDLLCYKEMYLFLFSQVSAALEALRSGKVIFAIDRLEVAQLYCEALFVDKADQE